MGLTAKKVYAVLNSKIKRMIDSGAATLLPIPDVTLTKAGEYADAKATGDRISELKQGKLDLQQGIENYGKVLGIGTDGVVIPVNAPSGGGGSATVDTDKTLTKSNAPADAKVVGDRLSSIEDYINTVAVPMTWRNIQNMIAKGYHKKVFKIGDKLTNTWSDPNASMKEYDNPFRINHFQDGVELESGENINGMWLQTQYAQLKAVQFSHQRAFLRCPNGLAPGTYYFTIESAWGNNVKAGDVVCFTTTQAVPTGGKVSGCYDAPNQTKDKWRIYTHSADGKEIIETITPTFEASGTDLGIQKSDKRNGNLNSTQEMVYGWNRWKTSAIRQYLNSDKLKGEWWTAQDEWDISPDQLSQIDGYLKGFDPELLAVIQPVKVTTYANTVNDGGVADVTHDKVILPSLEQMYIAPQISDEGEAHQYYKELNGTDTPYKQYGTFPELITYAIENHASAQYVRLRSASRSNAYNTWYVYASGYVSSNGNASSAIRPSPLVFIGSSPISAPTDAELGV